MRERTKIAYMAYMAIFVISLALVVLPGCGKGEETFKLDRLGLSMKLPPGWKQGEPRVIGAYRVSSRGEFFFENADYDDPSVSVMEFPLMGGSLTEYVDNLIRDTEATEKFQAGLLRTLGKIAGVEVSEEIKEAEKAVKTKVISKTPRTINKREAVETIKIR